MCNTRYLVRVLTAAKTVLVSLTGGATGSVAMDALTGWCHWLALLLLMSKVINAYYASYCRHAQRRQVC